jgi:RHS repeat-associated protein
LQAAVTAGTGANYAYTYDANGNMLTRTAATATTSFAYNTANELCWMYAGSSANPCSTPPTGATTYAFDADGNEISSSAAGSFTYNPKNQTIAMTYAGATLSPLTYAGLGQTQRTGAGATSFANGPSGLQISTASGNSTYYLRDNHGQLVGERIGTNHYYFLTDGLGSVLAVISGDGLSIGDQYAYDPYGNTTFHSGTVANPWGYAGGYTDPTGLVKFGARYYDPTVARWTQMDPLGQGSRSACAIACNPYTYAADDPINKADATGLWWWWSNWYGVGIDLNEGETRNLINWMLVASGIFWVAGFFWPIFDLIAAMLAVSAALINLVDGWGGNRGVWFFKPWWTFWQWPWCPACGVIMWHN